MNHIYWLSQVKQSERALVGDKLFTISQLLQHGCPMMPGFILDNNWLQQFLRNLDNSQSLIGNLPDSSLHLNVDDYRVLQSVAKASQETIDRADFPQSWQTEILESAQKLNSQTLIVVPYLAIPYQEHQGKRGLWQSHTCFSTPESLTAAVKRVWAELFTAKSLFYWHKLGLTIDKINLAILIRPLKPVEVSGVLEFDLDYIYIQAVSGLEMSLERGEVKPEEYKLNRETGAIIERTLGRQNYGYRPREFQDREKFDSCLEGHILNDLESTTYSLDEAKIAKLVKFAEDILQYQPYLKSLKWSLLPTASKTQIYFTDLDYLPPLRNRQNDRYLGFTRPLLKGLPAAPGSVTGAIAIIEDVNADISEIPHDCILVTKSIPPHRIGLLKQIKGIVTERGSMTSHAAIVAREIGIPAVVNASRATQILRSQREIFLNGDTGEIHRKSAQDRSLLAAKSSFSAPNNLVTATKLMVNISQVEAIAAAIDLPVDGVGLLRSELMLSEFLNSQSLAEWREKSQQEIFLRTLTNLLSQFAAGFSPRPVFYRSLDWSGKRNEINASLGDRGTYSYLLDATLFDLELQVLKNLRLQGHTNLNLILPFVRSVEEFKFCRRRAIDIGLTANSSFQLWIMAEVPSVIFLLPDYIRAGVQGIAIGTNDLTQLLLGVNREDSAFSNRGLNALHPAMERAMSQAIATARKNNIPCSLCGQAPVQYPQLIEKLVAWGITSISVEPEAVSQTLQKIARVERRLLLNSRLE